MKAAHTETAGRLRNRQRSSMRTRFVAYVLLHLCAVIALGLLLLHLLGGLNPAADLQQALDHQLDSSVAAVSEDMDVLASNAAVLSRQMSDLLEATLTGSGRSFGDLQDDPAALAALQSQAYRAVCSSLRTAPCSGAFYFLNTTVNSGLEQACYNGIYLKLANLNSENTVHSEISLYRGAASVARENDIHLHSTWQNELSAGAFPQLDAMMRRATGPSSDAYVLTAVYELPHTWERARFLCVPILDGQGSTVGVCGYEISNLLFKLSHKTVSAAQSYLVCALLDKTPEGYVGQVSGSQAGYATPVDAVFTVENGADLSAVRCGETVFYGKTRDITVGDGTHTLVVMLPKTQYDNIVRAGQFKMATALAAILTAAAVSCLHLSKRYVSPILKGLDQIKSDDRTAAQSSVSEIDEVFSFLARKDREHEDSLSALAAVQSENDSLLLECEQTRTAYEKAQDDLLSAKLELDRLTYSRKQEIDPNDYQNFLAGIQMLTKTEREIFDWYLAGKTAKEVLELTGTKESTLKFHNHNILQKPGVTSRKQMLRFSALMSQQQEGGSAV